MTMDAVTYPTIPLSPSTWAMANYTDTGLLLYYCLVASEFLFVHICKKVPCGIKKQITELNECTPFQKKIPEKMAEKFYMFIPMTTTRVNLLLCILNNVGNYWLLNVLFLIMCLHMQGYVHVSAIANCGQRCLVPWSWS